MSDLEGHCLEVHGADATVAVEVIPDERDVREVIASKTKTSSGREDVDDPYLVMDLGRILELYDLWNTSLPQVKIFYAVKCNYDLILLKTLAAMGVGFDCATKGEMKLVLGLGVTPDRIAYANPIKQVSHIQYAAHMGVELITFDCEEELLKILKHHPSPKLMLRVSGELTEWIPGPIAKYGNEEYLKVKFGVSVARGKTLLRRAKELGADVVGLSFLTGPGKLSVGAESIQYKQPIECCNTLFEYAATLGYDFSILDIGGGYPESELSFKEGAPEILKYVTEFGVKYPRAQIIAEPGRYFAASVCTLASCIISKKVAESGAIQYCMSESILGGCLTRAAYNSSEFKKLFQPLAVKESTDDVRKASFWGRTCGPDYWGDCETTNLEEGDWVLFENLGAYTLSMASTFHCFPVPVVYYYVREKHRQRLHQLLQST